MRTTCLINSYDYREFVSDAIDSVLRQSLPVDQIVVVDDGSTDGSAEFLDDRYGDDPRIEIIHQPNGGQLAAFEAGIRRADGDVVFFLDADDAWEPSYVETVVDRFESQDDVDFVFCGLQRFGQEDGTELPWPEDRALGYSLALTSHKRSWQGTSTSALAMRRWVLDRIFPVPFHEDWRIRADDCLVYGADLVGASKYYVAQPLVRYRVHDRNHFYGRSLSAESKSRRKLALDRFVQDLQRRLGRDTSRLADLAHVEFETVARPTRKDFVRYARVLRRADVSVLTRLKRLTRMAASAWRRRSEPSGALPRERVERWRLALSESQAERPATVDAGGRGAPRPRPVTLVILTTLALLTLLAGWVRVADLSTFALNPDESLVADLSIGESLAQTWEGTRLEPHPPGSFVAVHLIGRISRAPIVLRLFALVPGIALVPLLFLLGRAVRDDATGLVAAWFGAFGQAAVLLSGVVRPYSAAVACITLGLWCWIRARDDPRRRWQVGYALSFAAALLLHYSAAIPLLAMVAVSAGTRSRRALRAASVPLAVAAGLLVFRIPAFWSSDVRPALIDGWLAPFFPPIGTAFARATGDVLGYLFLDSAGAWLAALVLAGGIVLWRAGGRGRDLAATALLTLGAAVVLAALRLYPFGAVRHVYYLWPFAAVMVAASLAWVWARIRALPWMRRPVARAAVGAALAFVLSAQAASLLAEQGFFRTRGYAAYMEYPVPAATVDRVLQFVSERTAPGDTVLINGQTAAMLRYAGELEAGTVRDRAVSIVPRPFFESEEQLDATLRDLAPRLDGGRLWLLNLGWRSIDDALPVGGWGRGLLADGVVMDGAYAGAIPVAALRPDADGASGRYRVDVRRDGVHRLRYEDLGFPGALPASLPSSRLGVSHRGEPVPVWVEDGGDGAFGPGDRIEFVGRHLRGANTHFDEYSDHNVYWLDLDTDAPARMAVWEPDGTCGGVEQRRRVHLEQEQLRVRFPARRVADIPESWYWARLTPLDAEPATVDLPLDDLDPGAPWTLRVRLRGWSHLREEPDRSFTDHAVDVTLDGRPLGRAEWDSRADGFVFETEVASLTGAAPRLELAVPSRTVGEDPRPRADVVLLDWIELDYARKADVPDAPLRLEPEDGCVAFRDAPREPLWLYDEAGKRARLAPGLDPAVSQAAGPVYVVPDGAWEAPARVVRDHPSTWRSPDHQADYLIVAHERLRFAVQPLVELHRRRGLTVEVVDVQDIYDEFHDGVVHPDAIRDFFRYTHESWQEPAPRFALLVGDASFDPRSEAAIDERDYDDRVFRANAGHERERAGGYWYPDRNRENHRNLIPTYTYTGADGQAASDFAFVDFGAGDHAPAMAIGRFPVTEPEEVGAIVAKTIRHVEQAEQAERGRILWITNEMASFQRRTERLATEAEGFEGVRVFPGDGRTNAEIREELLRAFDDGPSLVHFLGHGGRFIWQTGRPDLTDDRDLFTLDDVERIRAGGRLAVILSMTCYSAPFDHPNADSIGERFLRVADRGAVAVVAASWRVSPTYQMSNLLMEEFTRRGTIGEAVARAKTRSSSRTFKHLFNLLGDPAAPIALPVAPEGS